MVRLKPPRQVLTLHRVGSHGKFILQKRVSMLNVQATSTFLFSLHTPHPPNTQLKKET